MRLNNAGGAGRGHYRSAGSGKQGYWTNPECPAIPEEWLENAAERKGSCWPEWLRWLEQYAGERIPARVAGEGVEDAPGSYVRVRAVEGKAIEWVILPQLVSKYGGKGTLPPIQEPIWEYL